MADFKQAIKWLKEGKKVRRKSISNKHWYLFLSEEIGSKGFVFLHHSNLLEPYLWHQSIDMLEANDWDVCKETLSDKEEELEKNGRVMYWREDVKEFIEKIKKDVRLSFNNLEEWDCCEASILHNIDKEAGPKLT